MNGAKIQQCAGWTDTVHVPVNKKFMSDDRPTVRASPFRPAATVLKRKRNGIKRNDPVPERN